jgi:hypothetical protein
VLKDSLPLDGGLGWGRLIAEEACRDARWTCRSSLARAFARGGLFGQLITINAVTPEKSRSCVTNASALIAMALAT